MKEIFEGGERLDVGVIHREILTKLGKMSYDKATMIYDTLDQLEHDSLMTYGTLNQLDHDSLMVFATEILANAYGVSSEEIINKIEGE